MIYTEITFLLELILNHKLPLSTKNLIKDRIGLLQQSLPQPGIRIQPVVNELNRAVAENTLQSTIIAQTPAVAEALAHRQQTIAIASSGVAEKGRTSPRKF